MSTNAFGNTIKSLRNKLKLTQSELAERLGCTSQHIVHLEKGERTGSKGLAEKLGVFFEMEKELMELWEERRLQIQKRKQGSEQYKEREKGITESVEQNFVSMYPDYIDAFAKQLCLVEEGICRDVIADFTQQLHKKLYRMLPPLELREIKKLVMDIKRHWFSLEVSEDFPTWTEKQGYRIISEKEVFLSLQLDHASFSVTLLYGDKKQIDEFFPWLDEYHVSFVDEMPLPHVTVPQKVAKFIWFSPAFPVLDRYRYLRDQSIEINGIQCNEKQLKWLIQNESRRHEKEAIEEFPAS